MPHRPKKVKKSDKAGDLATGQKRSMQTDAQRRQEMATRSILSRFQNRKSEKK